MNNIKKFQKTYKKTDKIFKKLLSNNRKKILKKWYYNSPINDKGGEGRLINKFMEM